MRLSNDWNGLPKWIQSVAFTSCLRCVTLYVMAALPFVFNTHILLCFLSGAHPIPIHWTINFTCTTTTKRWIQTKEKKKKNYWKCVECECSEYFERMTKPHAHFLFSCLLFLFRIHNYGMHFTMQIVQCKLHVTTDWTHYRSMYYLFT